MKKYNVRLPWYATVIVKGVEAESEQDAIEKAYEDAFPTLCYQCSDDVELDEAMDFKDASAYEIKNEDTD